MWEKHFVKSKPRHQGPSPFLFWWAIWLCFPFLKPPRQSCFWWTQSKGTLRKHFCSKAFIATTDSTSDLWKPYFLKHRHTCAIFLWEWSDFYLSNIGAFYPRVSFPSLTLSKKTSVCKLNVRKFSFELNDVAPMHIIRSPDFWSNAQRKGKKENCFVYKSLLEYSY